MNTDNNPAPLPQRGTDTVELTPANGRANENRRAWSTVLQCCPEHAVLVRRHVRRAANLPTPASEDLERLACELFNNAWEHSRSADNGTVCVSVFRFPHCIQIKVIDDGPRAEGPKKPAIQPVDPSSENGFGLFLLDSESDRWASSRKPTGAAQCGSRWTANSEPIAGR